MRQHFPSLAREQLQSEAKKNPCLPVVQGSHPPLMMIWWKYGHRKQSKKLPLSMWSKKNPASYDLRKRTEKLWTSNFSTISGTSPWGDSTHTGYCDVLFGNDVWHAKSNHAPLKMTSFRATWMIYDTFSSEAIIISTFYAFFFSYLWVRGSTCLQFRQKIVGSYQTGPHKSRKWSKVQKISTAVPVINP